MNTMLKAALRYAEMGYPVFPCVPGDKMPLTPHGFHDATTDAARIEAWWEAHPDANVALATEGLAVIDVDGPDNPWPDDAQRTADLSGCPMALTPRGGRHHIFRQPAGRSWGCSTGKVATHVDTRANGGYIVVLPSVVGGKPYSWAPSRALEAGPQSLAEPPEWLRALLDTISGNGSGAPADAHRAPQDADLPTTGNQIPVGQRNAALARLAGTMRRVGMTQVEIRAALERTNRDRCQPPLDQREVERIATSISRYEPDQVAVAVAENHWAQDAADHIDPAGLHPSDTGRASPSARTHGHDEREGPPTITIEGGELPAIVDEAEAALLSDPGPRIYQRAGSLVRVIRMESLTVRRGLKREAGALVIHPIEAPYLVERFTAAARWRKYDQRMGRYKAIDCPEQVAKAYMARRGSWQVAPLIGIIEAPTLRADGSILDTPGYDEGTGLFFDPGLCEFAKIPEHPSQKDAMRALGEFIDLLKDFPFVDPKVDGMAAVAAILTALVRKSLPSAPLFVFRAPKMRSGKTLLADVVSMLATGRPCAVMSQALGPERASEERKRLLAVLLEGDPVVNFDNCEHALEGAALCMAITQETMKDLVLGASRTATASTAVTLLATGNNLVIAGDLVARVVPCDLDPRVEHPEERHFDRDLYEFVPANRGRLVAQALTILRAYHVAGMPAQPIPPWGGFDEWSRWIRGSLTWCGLGDPAVGRGCLEVLDPVRQSLRALLLAWHDALGSRTVSVAEVVREAEQHEDLRAVLVDQTGGMKGEIRPKALGRFLQKHASRIEDGLRVERVGDRQGKALWRVCRIAEEA